MIGFWLAFLVLLPSIVCAAPVADWPTNLFAINIPAHYYNFAETSGAATTDVGVNYSQSDGTFTGGYTKNQSGIPGYAASKSVAFDGSAGTHGTITLTNTTMFKPNTSNGGKWAVGAWFKVSSLQTAVLVASADTGGGSNFDWFINIWSDGAVGFNIWGGATACGGANYANSGHVGSYSTGVWHHLVLLTVGGGVGTLSSVKLYLDGVQVDSQTSFSGTICGADGPLYLGGNKNGANVDNRLTGNLAEVTFFPTETAPSAAQILDLYNCGFSGGASCSSGATGYRATVLNLNPFAYYRMGGSSFGACSSHDELNTNPGSYNFGWSGPETGALTNDADAAAKTDGGVQGNMNIPNRTPFSISPGASRSVIFWAKMNGAASCTSGRLLEKNTEWRFTTGAGGASDFRIMFLTFTTGFGTHGYGITNSALTTSYKFFAFTDVDNVRIRSYVNGVLENDLNTFSGTQFTDTSAVSLGIAGEFCAITVDELAFFDTELTQANITQIYNAGLGIFGGSGWPFVP